MLPDFCSDKIGFTVQVRRILQLAKLQCGVTAVYQNDWLQPVLCKVYEYTGYDKNFLYQKSDDTSLAKARNLTALKQIVLNSAKVDKLKLKEKIEAIAIDDFKLIDAWQVAALFPNNDTVFKSALKTAAEHKTKLDGLNDYLVKHIEPSLNYFSESYRQFILKCIVETNCERDKSLRELPDMWNRYIAQRGTNNVR